MGQSLWTCNINVKTQQAKYLYVYGINKKRVLDFLGMRTRQESFADGIYDVVAVQLTAKYCYYCFFVLFLNVVFV